jgi:glycosyltransferase involved in cell wall biosynthesis
VKHPESRAARRVLILNWRDTGHPDGGGSEVYAERTADGLASGGYEVTLLTARYPGSARRETRPSGVVVRRAGGRLGVYPRAALTVLLRQVPRPDVIIETQNGIPFLASVWARSLPQVVLVHHVHREQWPVVFPAPLARAGWWVESRLAPRVNRGRPYVTVSERTRSELAELGVDPARVRVIHNGVLPPPRHDVVRAPQPQLLVLGRLVPHKRVEIAMTVAERLRPEFPGLRLVVAGRGWWEDKLRREVADRGLGEFVDLVGYVSEEERHRLYASSWVSLVPSLKEGWGLVVVEAGLHETPSVAFDGAGGVAESIQDGQTGLLARADDVDHFTALTRSLLLDQSERARLGANAARFAGQFTWAQTVARFERLVADVCEGRDPAQPTPELAEPALD